MTLANFSSLTDYSSIKLTSEKAIKTEKDYKYFTAIQNPLKVFLYFFYNAQIVKFLPDNNTISYFICFDNTTNKANINLSLTKCKQITCNILIAKLYAIAYGFNIKKQN